MIGEGELGVIGEGELGVLGGGELVDCGEGELAGVVVERWVLGMGGTWSSPSTAPAGPRNTSW